MTKRTTLLCLLVLIFLQTPSQGQSFRKQDAGLGGLAGAVIGGIIGHQNDEVAEGALIGGALGALAGGVVGAEKDQQVRQHRYYQQSVRQHHAWQRQRQARAVTVQDVVTMSQSGISDAVILNHIRANGLATRIGTHEIISLHKQGVSERLITAMQSQSSGLLGEPQTTVVQRQPVSSQRIVTVEEVPPVIVREEIRVRPAPIPIQPHWRIRYSTRPAFPRHPGRFHSYW